jgi:hypothetical protein
MRVAEHEKSTNRKRLVEDASIVGTEYGQQQDGRRFNPCEKQHSPKGSQNFGKLKSDKVPHFKEASYYTKIRTLPLLDIDGRFLTGLKVAIGSDMGPPTARCGYIVPLISMYRND